MPRRRPRPVDRLETAGSGCSLARNWRQQVKAQFNSNARSCRSCSAPPHPPLPGRSFNPSPPFSPPPARPPPTKAPARRRVTVSASPGQSFRIHPAQPRADHGCTAGMPSTRRRWAGGGCGPRGSGSAVGPATVGVDDPMGTTEATPARPPVVGQTEWDAALTGLTRARADRRRRDARTRRRTEAHADGAGGARLRVRGS